ncbi:hypothetical protein OJAV_G00076650 [Oryzias javanicus]|uniref:Small integral membrane protein 5 n=1 Tax=Oryzias javanicus TaxID=123683 RepID=A0A3S2Q3X6_ORYJA|nr:hypothetical protein OJAV_G00076650 [Oryzias javanicus]
MDAREETLGLLKTIWVKLRGLSSENPLDLGAFFIILAFILMVTLALVLISVSYCCCCCRRKKKRDGAML